MRSTPLFLSSGDLIADRRYQHARDFEARGDLAAAADLLAQAVERAPDFASAWFVLGELREKLGDRAGATTAFARACAADAEDRHGAGLHLARLGVGEAGAAMSPSYVRTLFEQYAVQFDDALRRLDYRGPELLREAIAAALSKQARAVQFDRVLDLGCGTGLMAEALRGAFDSIVGVDLSPAMIEQARRKGVYNRLVVGDMLAFLQDEIDAAADLIVSADALVYLSDLVPVCRAVARVLEPGGLFAFTVETHEGDGVVVGEKLRYAHGAAHVRGAIAGAGLTLRHLAAASTRTESGAPAPGLIAVAAHSAAQSKGANASSATYTSGVEDGTSISVNDSDRRELRDGRLVDCDGVQVHCIDRGNPHGKTIVFIHGLGSMIQEFACSGVFEPLQDEFRILCLDRPGYGKTGRPRGKEWTPPEQAELFSTALQKLNVGSCVVVAHSWGRWSRSPSRSGRRRR